MASTFLSPATNLTRNLSSPFTISIDSSNKKNTAALLLHDSFAFPDVLPVGLELLDLTMTNASDERISICVERINAFVKADALKRELFSQAILNISKARDQNGTTLFCESILKCPKPSLSKLMKSRESFCDWSDKWLEKFQDRGDISGSVEPPGWSLKRHFDGMAKSLAASELWLLNVRKAKESLLKLLHPHVVRA